MKQHLILLEHSFCVVIARADARHFVCLFVARETEIAHIKMNEYDYKISKWIACWCKFCILDTTALRMKRQSWATVVIWRLNFSISSWCVREFFLWKTKNIIHCEHLIPFNCMLINDKNRATLSSIVQCTHRMTCLFDLFMPLRLIVFTFSNAQQ